MAATQNDTTMFLLSGQTNIKFTFDEKPDFDINGQKKLTVLELTSLLYDFTLLHDCIALTAIPDYKNYYFSRNFWYRKGRRLKPEHQLYLNKINHNSPLGLEIIIPLTVGSVTVPWLILQAVEKIQNWKLNREKLELEIEKLRLDNHLKNMESFNKDIELSNLLKRREAIDTFYRVVKRIDERQLSATDIQVIHRNPNDKNQDDNAKK